MLANTISKNAYTIDKNPGYRRQFLTVAGQRGLFRHVGANSYADLCADLETIGYSTQSMGYILGLNAHLWGIIYPLQHFASDAQRFIYLEKALQGEIIGGHAITEPGSGSDLSQMQTMLVEDGSDFLLNGEKIYITNAGVADFLVVYARHGQGLSAVLVDTACSTCHIQEMSNMDVCNDSSIASVRLRNHKVKATDIIGKPHAGLNMIQTVLEHERAFIFAGIYGIAKWQIEELIKYSRSRKINGSTLNQMQAISHRIADLYLKLETMKLWIDQCIQLKLDKKRITLASSYTKLFCAENYLFICTEILHLMGAIGFDKKLPYMQLVNDAMAARLFSGSSEVQKNIICGLKGVSY